VSWICKSLRFVTEANWKDVSAHSVFAMLFENLIVTEEITDFYFFERSPSRNQCLSVLSQNNECFQQVSCCSGPCGNPSMNNPGFKPYLGTNFYINFFSYWELHQPQHEEHVP